ncbi:MAG: helix-turn-helix domain-containing protein [Myxococcales bacterium]|nr:helix-turn-helix domain-containing protein [Myxococcales bacterium]
MKILGKQVVAARGLLGWTQGQLASAADVAIDTVVSWERGEHHPRESTVRRVVEVIEARGVEFTNGGAPGVRFKPKPEAAENESAGK